VKRWRAKRESDQFVDGVVRLEEVPLVWARVVEERARQDAVHGLPADRVYSWGDWLSVLVEEVGEVAQLCQPGAVTTGAGERLLVSELVQVAAVAIAFAESLVGDS